MSENNANASELRKAILCFKRSKTKSYIGGVISIMDHYLAHKAIFNDCGYDIDEFTYQRKKDFPNQKIDNVLYSIEQRRALIKKLKSGRIDVVNIHTSMEFLFLKDVMLAHAIANKSKAKVILTVHVGAAETVFNRIKKFQPYCIRTINKYIHKIVFLSNEIRDEFVKMGVNLDRTEVLYNFHSLEPDCTSNERADDCLKLLFVGAITRDKGIIELLEAVNRLKNLNIHLDICGQLTDKTIENRFEALLRALGKKVEFHGYVKGATKTELYHQSDVLILPSYHEGMPLVVLEALAGGCAIISTRVGATPEILTENNAIWVDIADSTGVEKAIQNLYDDRTLLLNMKEANIVRSRDFSIRTNIAALCDIYNS